MPQNDMILENQTFPSMLSDMNSALQAGATLQSGTSAPSTTYQCEWWANPDDLILYMRATTNDAWVEVAKLNAASWGKEALNTNLGMATGLKGTLLKSGDSTYSVINNAVVNVEQVFSGALANTIVDKLADAGTYTPISTANTAPTITQGVPLIDATYTYTPVLTSGKIRISYNIVAVARARNGSSFSFQNCPIYLTFFRNTTLDHVGVGFQRSTQTVISGEYEFSHSGAAFDLNIRISPAPNSGAGDSAQEIWINSFKSSTSVVSNNEANEEVGARISVEELN